MAYSKDTTLEHRQPSGHLQLQRLLNRTFVAMPLHSTLNLSRPLARPETDTPASPRHRISKTMATWTRRDAIVLSSTE